MSSFRCCDCGGFDNEHNNDHGLHNLCGFDGDDADDENEHDNDQGLYNPVGFDDDDANDDNDDHGGHNLGGFDNGVMGGGGVWCQTKVFSSGKCIMEGWLCDQEHDCRYHRNSQNHHHNDDFDASV